MVSNSKQNFRNGYRLQDEAVERDGKPYLFENFAKWLLEWQNEKIS